MKAASIRDMRNQFARISGWIERGESVSITKRGKPFAVLSPVPPETPRPVQWPDFQSRMRNMFPNAIPGKSLSEVVRESRGERSLAKAAGLNVK